MENNAAPYSWGDIADLLTTVSNGTGTPDSLIKVEIYWDQAIFFLESLAAENSVIAWLGELFPFRVSTDSIKLDGPAFSAQLPIAFEVYDPELNGVAPLDIPAQYVAASSQIWFRRERLVGNLPVTHLPTFAFHSVKGGVGRTTSALSFALSLAEKHNQRPLLVDADFEAPGISYLFHEDGREAYFSFEDLIVLSHADSDPTAERTVQFAAEKLANHQQNGLTILPCFRTPGMLTSFAIRPEQLQRSHSDRPFFLLDLLKRVAKSTNCTCLVIDLRAGFTDLASMTLCAPQIAPVFVTTPSGQAVASTRQMLDFISAELNSHASSRIRPAIIINNVISQVKRSREFEETVRAIEDSASGFIENSSVMIEASDVVDFRDDIAGSNIVALDHAPALTAAPVSMQYFIEDLKGQACFAQLDEGLRRWAAAYIDSFGSISTSGTVQEAKDVMTVSVASEPTDLQALRAELRDFARRRIFAESEDSTTQDFLVVRALNELGTRFRTELPNATCIGMKGAGKTFTFRVLCECETWAVFLTKIKKVPSTGEDAIILPVLPARNLQRMSFLNEVRKRAADMLGDDDPIPFSRLNEAVDEASRRLTSESDWGEFWLDCIAWSCGVKVGTTGAGSHLIERLIERRKKIVAAFDGLEESFQQFRNMPSQQAAIRGLTSTLPQRLSELPDRPLGQINFVRSDLIGAAFPNNSRQFADRNRAFALTWYDRDILELALWIVQSAGVANNHLIGGDGNSKRQLEEALRPLWGHKLGKADDLSKEGRTREPRSAEWVLAALSDLRGRLTARDLVRFIAASAERSENDGNPLYYDRLLVPRAMMAAIGPVGTEKIDAMAEENPGLKKVVELIRNAPQFSVPIKLEELLQKVPGLEGEDQRMLEENGIIIVTGDTVEMPEIFRTGLGNVVRATGGRRSIIGLMNKARQQRGVDATL